MNTIPRHYYPDPTEQDDLVLLGRVYCPVQLVSGKGLNYPGFTGFLIP